MIAPLVVPVLAVIGAFSCDDPPLLPCGQIPGGGCPVGRGGTCTDVTCTDLFDCVNGKWTNVKHCRSGQGGGGSSSSAMSSSTGPCTGTMFDHSKEKTGCAPDLESPDCSSDVAETCQPCVTGCSDFLMCQATGWVAVAYCDASGKLVLKTTQ